MTDVPTFTPKSTFREILSPAIEIAQEGDTAKGDEYVSAYEDYLMANYPEKYPTRHMAHRTVMDNIGYWAGYYDSETMTLVREFYGAEHPVFGSNRPTPEEAFEAGRKLARGDS